MTLVLAMLVGWTTSSSAAVRIRHINFDPAGVDTGSNAHLNEEWIVIKNTGSHAVQMRGWTILDRDSEHVYRFSSLLLRGGERAKLHVGSGNDGAAACEAGEACSGTLYDLHWGLHDYVWENDADVARLRDRSGRLVDECRYSSTQGTTTITDLLSPRDQATRC